MVLIPASQSRVISIVRRGVNDSLPRISASQMLVVIASSITTMKWRRISWGSWPCTRAWSNTVIRQQISWWVMVCYGEMISAFQVRTWRWIAIARACWRTYVIKKGVVAINSISRTLTIRTAVTKNIQGL